jgi:hypothetical protein
LLDWPRPDRKVVSIVTRIVDFNLKLRSFSNSKKRSECRHAVPNMLAALTGSGAMEVSEMLRLKRVRNNIT